MRSLQSIFRRRRPPVEQPADPVGEPVAPLTESVLQVDLAIAPDDPLLGYLQMSGTVADVTTLRLESPALAKLREAGVKLVVPLVSQGELLGLISLGPRRSDQEYSSDDRRLLADLASRAAPSVRVAQLVRQQQIETLSASASSRSCASPASSRRRCCPRNCPTCAGTASRPTGSRRAPWAVTSTTSSSFTTARWP